MLVAEDRYWIKPRICSACSFEPFLPARIPIIEPRPLIVEPGLDQKIRRRAQPFSHCSGTNRRHQVGEEHLGVQIVIAALTVANGNIDT
jgi:hypothetical protein